MHTLTSADTMSIQLAAPKATNDCSWRVSYWDAVVATAAIAGEGSYHGNTNGTSLVQMLESPAIGNTRHARAFWMTNTDTAPVTVSIVFATAGFKAILAVGDVLQMTEKEGWWVTDASGAIKNSLASLSWGSIIGTLSNQADLSSALAGKVAGNAAITASGATNKIVQYDTKGLVVSGVDATTANVPDTTDKRYVTDAHMDLVGRTSLALHTGVIDGCAMSINGSDGTKIDVASGHVQYVDDSDPSNPVVETLTFAGTTVTPTVGGQGLDVLYKVWVGVARQSSGVGVLQFSNMFFSDAQRRRIAVLGTTWAATLGGTTIAAVSNYPSPAWGAAKWVEDLAYALGGSINVDGNDFSAHTGQLTLDKSSGHAFRLFGASSSSKDNPNNPTASAAAPVTSYRYWAASGSSYGNAASSTIDPNYYDNAGTRTSVPAGKWTIQRVYWFPSTSPTPIVAITYGQAYFDTLDAAKAAANSQVIVFSDVATNGFFGGLLRARLYVQQGATDLSGAYVERMTQFVGGGAGSGGGSVSDHATLSHLDYASAGHTGFVPATRRVAGHDLSADVTVSKSDVGLGSVPNTDCTTTANITDSTDKRFCTDAQKTVIGNTSGTNTGDQTLPTDATIATTDVTTNNATTTKHGWQPKAVAPAANQLAVVGIANGETATSYKVLIGSGTPTTQAFGDVAAHGTSVEAAPIDHKHAMPAAPTASSVGLGSVTNDAQTKAAMVPNTAPSAGQLLVGNAGGTAYAPVSATGDVAVASTGAMTIQSNAVTNAKSAQMAGYTLKGNATGSTANPSDIALSSANLTALGNLSGTNTGDQTLPTDATITITDVTTNNAGTTKHGWAPKVTAPAANQLVVVGIANGETAVSGKTIIGATTPTTQAFGDSAAHGTSVEAASADHKHAMPAAPTASSVGAEATLGNPTSDGFVLSSTAAGARSWVDPVAAAIENPNLHLISQNLTIPANSVLAIQNDVVEIGSGYVVEIGAGSVLDVGVGTSTPAPRQPGTTTVAASNGTTYLNNTSTRQQIMSGSGPAGHTFVLPDVTTLPNLDFTFELDNASTGSGSLTIKSFDLATTIAVLISGQCCLVNSISATAQSGWEADVIPANYQTGQLSVRKWTAWGHSYFQNGVATYDQTGRFDCLARSMLGLSTDDWYNMSINGARITCDGSIKQGQGGWVTIAQNTQYRGTQAGLAKVSPYTSSGGGHMVCLGLNDMGNYGPDTQHQTAFIHAMRFAISRMRAAVVFDNTDGSVAYGAGFTAVTGQDSISTMATLRNATSTTNATFTITIPADYKGEKIAICLIGRPGSTGGVVTWSGTAGLTGTLSCDNIMASGDSTTCPVIVRYTAPITGGTQTIIGTVTSVNTTVSFDSWWLESKNPPPVIVCNLSRLGATAYAAMNSGTFYPAWTAASTSSAQRDADVLRWNAALLALTAEFDAMVQIADCDTPIAGNDAYYSPNAPAGLHYNELGGALGALALVNAYNRCAPPSTATNLVACMAGSPATRQGASYLVRPANYYMMQGARYYSTAYTNVAGDVFAIPFQITQGNTRFTAMAVNCAAYSNTGTSIRFAVFADNQNTPGIPGTLISEKSAGISVTATGLAAVTGLSDLEFDPGIIWLVIKFNTIGASNTFAQIQGPSPLMPNLPTTGLLSADSQHPIAWKLTSQANAAFNIRWPTGATLVATAPYIALLSAIPG